MPLDGWVKHFYWSTLAVQWRLWFTLSAGWFVTHSNPHWPPAASGVRTSNPINDGRHFATSMARDDRHEELATDRGGIYLYKGEIFLFNWCGIIFLCIFVIFPFVVNCMVKIWIFKELFLFKSLVKIFKVWNRSLLLHSEIFCAHVFLCMGHNLT